MMYIGLLFFALWIFWFTLATLEEKAVMFVSSSFSLLAYYCLSHV